MTFKLYHDAILHYNASLCILGMRNDMDYKHCLFLFKRGSVMKNWNDIQYFLVVAEEGSMSAGGRRLGVNQSTVSRRISALEDELKVRLFEHLSKGYVLTQTGEEFLIFAKAIEIEMTKIDQVITGADTQLAGNIRITTVESLANLVLIPIVAKFIKLHPEISVDIIISENIISLTQRQADIALRATNSPPENLVGRRVIKGVTFATYGSIDYLNSMGNIEKQETFDLNDPKSPFSWVGWDDEGSGVKYYGPSCPKDKVRCKFNTVTTMIEAVKAGIGIAQLPCLLGDAEPQLKRISSIDKKHIFDVWMLIHSNLRHIARFRVFLDFFAEELTTLEILRLKS